MVHCFLVIVHCSSSSLFVHRPWFIVYRSLSFPSIFPYQLNKSTPPQVLLFYPGLCLGHPKQILNKSISHRNNQSSSCRQLIDQRLRNIRRPCRDHNGIEWTL